MTHFIVGLCDDKNLNILMRYVLDLVVTEEMKTWTQGIVRAQWNESDWYVTDFVLSS